MSKNTGTSELINYFDLGVNGDVGIAGSLDINTIANATTDTDTFLVSDTGIIKYRTGAQLLSDIGAQAAGNYVTLDTAQSITGVKTFNSGSLILAANGTASPTIIRNTSGTTGSTGGFNTIGFNSNNNIFVDTTNSGGFIFDFNNSVSNRTYTLQDASGTLAFTSQIPANPVGGTGAAGRVAYWNGSGTITSDSLFQWNDTFRRLGIGCTPTVSLDVVGAGVFTGALSVGGALNGTSATFSGGNYINGTFQRNVGNGSLIEFKNYATTTQYNWFVGCSYNNSNVFEIIPSTAANNDSPSGTSVLSIASTGAATFSSNQNATSTYTFQNTDSINTNSRLRLDLVSGNSALSFISIHNNHNYISSVDGKDLYFQQSFTGTTNLLIKSNGNVLIGTTTDNGARLQVAGNLTTATLLVRNDSNSQTIVGIGNRSWWTGGASNNDAAIGTYSPNMCFFTNNSGTERMRITSDGILKMSNNSTTFSIGDIGGVQRIQHGTNGFTTEFQFFGAYDGYAPIGASAFNTRSDYRLKEDLKEFSGLSLVTDMKVYDFKWKEQDERNYGFMAHELQEILPYVVTGTKDGMFEGELQMQGVDYSKLVPILVKAIQEQQQQIDKLKNL